MDSGSQQSSKVEDILNKALTLDISDEEKQKLIKTIKEALERGVTVERMIEILNELSSKKSI